MMGAGHKDTTTLEEFRTYAYMIGYRMAELGLNKKVKLLAHYGSGEADMMGDFAWGARDAYEAHGKKSSILCAFNITKFWKNGDSESELNNHFHSNIVAHNPRDGGFTLRKSMMFNGLDTLIALPGAAGTRDELSSAEVEAQHGFMSAGVLVANLPIGEDGERIWGGYLHTTKAMVRAGLLTSADANLIQAPQPDNLERSELFSRHADHMLNVMCQRVGLDKTQTDITPKNNVEILAAYRHKKRSCGSKEPLKSCVCLPAILRLYWAPETSTCITPPASLNINPRTNSGKSLIQRPHS
jgi:predicted Rossmann-fold nucleotide-binding protein